MVPGICVLGWVGGFGFKRCGGFVYTPQTKMPLSNNIQPIVSPSTAWIMGISRFLEQRH